MNWTSQSWWAYLQLMRPPNIITAHVDILVGYAASGATEPSRLGWLLLATTGLYGGGVVFNDVFDAELDAIERPERPIPSDRASRQGAVFLGSFLLLAGIAAAAKASPTSALLAATIAIAALVYDAVGKHHPLFGPLNMGICRGANLLLGVSAVPIALEQWWGLAIVPIVYIAAITAISRGEVGGGRQSTGWLAIVLVVAVTLATLALGILPNYSSWIALPFAVLFAGLVWPPFWNAATDPSADSIRNAVRTGVLCLIVLDATVAAGFAGWVYGLLVLGLLPISWGLARVFAVT
jgi:4-hydroxybenzoate polyprenyltransferase